jgi:hypothetical protein
MPEQGKTSKRNSIIGAGGLAEIIGYGEYTGNYWLPKRERKMLVKKRAAELKENALQEKARLLKHQEMLPEKKIGLRLRRSLYWVRKALGKQEMKKKRRPLEKLTRIRFKNINESARLKIDQCISSFKIPIQIPELADKLQ